MARSATHRPPPPPSAKEVDAAFRRNARKIATALRQDASGKTCGTCAHAILSSSGSGACMALLNIHGQSLTIVRADAVACRDTYVRAMS